MTLLPKRLAVHLAAISVAVLCAVGCSSRPDDALEAASVNCPKNISAWKSGTSYTVGHFVTYHSAVYRCRQAHTAQSDWTPPATPALWERVTCSTGGGGSGGSGGGGSGGSGGGGGGGGGGGSGGRGGASGGGGGDAGGGGWSWRSCGGVG